MALHIQHHQVIAGRDGQPDPRHLAPILEVGAHQPHIGLAGPARFAAIESRCRREVLLGAGDDDLDHLIAAHVFQESSITREDRLAQDGSPAQWQDQAQSTLGPVNIARLV